jgi:hypothetical protein
LCESHCGYHEQSFTFVCNSNNEDFKRSIGFLIGQSVNSIEFKPGVKYLCIEYLDDSGDHNFYSGYIGTLADYLEWLENEFVKAHSI